MNKHESCVYYLFKETFTNGWVKTANYSTLIGFAKYLEELLAKCKEEIKVYEEL